jgi:uncharacterized repeat protein (TIGR01451 family)
LASKSAAGSRPQEGVLMARKSPLLTVETVGPRRIMVGKESVYELMIHNSGEVAAEDVAVFVNLPAWADMSGAEATTGTTQLGAPGDLARPLQWGVGQLAAGGREKLVLRIVARERRPFDLAVRWDSKPVASQAMIEVQEPKLLLQLDAPREVIYGKKEVFTLKIANSGTGDAENVAVTLLPVGTAENRPASHKLGVIAAGEEKAVEVELTARQAGELLIQVEAHGDGGAHADLSQKILVRRATLRVDVEGPQMQYIGAVVVYRIRLNNLGNAPARNVRLSVNLPAGVKYLSGIDGSRLEANGTKLQWTLDNLNPTVEQNYLMKCSLGLPGVSQLEVVASADDLTASAAATTRVEAMADLSLEVKDPAGPVSLADEAIYEVRIRNRGSKNAEGVEVMAFFSRGVEPVSVEGGLHKITPGQVVFNPIPSVAPGTDLLLKIHARAEAPGNHVFRAEVHCRPLGTRAVSEQTTHFYQEMPALPQNASVSAAETAPPQTLRTADRRESLPMPPRLEPAVAAPRGGPAVVVPSAGPNPALPPRESPPATLRR